MCIRDSPSAKAKAAAASPKEGKANGKARAKRQAKVRKPGTPPKGEAEENVATLHDDGSAVLMIEDILNAIAFAVEKFAKLDDAMITRMQLLCIEFALVGKVAHPSLACPSAVAKPDGADMTCLSDDEPAAEIVKWTKLRKLVKKLICDHHCE
eukprot:13407701-Alexandrium_andersonii.AAC.1